MWQDSLIYAQILWQSIQVHHVILVVLMPVWLLVEIPLFLLVQTGIFRWAFYRQQGHRGLVPACYPSISFVITCYDEGDGIGVTIDTLVEQVYPGEIEILAVIDGAVQNSETYAAAVAGVRRHRCRPMRNVRVIPKWQRGGRVSTLNAGLFAARHELVINVDGDTSFDNTMALALARQFDNPNILACGGALRVRNWRTSLLTRMQQLEYMLSMQASKTGLARWGVLNNISGAFGAFRKSALKQCGGWDTHTAEDLDLTVRLKQYMRRYPRMKLGFEPHAVGHTDVPDTLKGLIAQRLRWDGDLFFLFLRKHRAGLTPRLLGWGNFIFILVYGVLQNVLLPLLAVGYLIFMIFSYPMGVVLGTATLVYLVYFTMNGVGFVIYLCLVSERWRNDLGNGGWLLVYPIYQFLMRLITTFSMFNEVIRRSHEESSMAPWWVLKRGKRF